MKETNKKLASLLGIAEEVYESEVNRLVRERYPLSRELSILRRRDTAPEEFAAYNAYAEECKRRARAALGRDA